MSKHIKSVVKSYSVLKSNAFTQGRQGELLWNNDYLKNTFAAEKSALRREFALLISKTHPDKLSKNIKLSEKESEKLKTIAQFLNNAYPQFWK